MRTLVLALVLLLAGCATMDPSEEVQTASAAVRPEGFHELSGTTGLTSDEDASLEFDVPEGARSLRATLWWNGTGELTLTLAEPGACSREEVFDELRCSVPPDGKTRAAGGPSPQTLEIRSPAKGSWVATAAHGASREAEFHLVVWVDAPLSST